MQLKHLLLGIILTGLISPGSFGQANIIKATETDTATIPQQDSLAQQLSLSKQKDIKDVVAKMFKTTRKSTIDDDMGKDTRKHFSFVPAAGYTLQTGFAAIASANLAYFNDLQKDTKLSSISTSLTYSQYDQIIIPIQANIWSKGNKYNYITDIRFISYPSSIYGLGGRTDPNKGVTIDFVGLKVHQTVMKALSKDVYVGIGYYFDRFWNIKALDQVSNTVDHQITKQLGTEETASGPAFRFLYDTRLNQLNPQQGSYLNVSYRANIRSLGSDSNSNALQIDARTYFNYPATSKNVLAFWMFDWLVANGTPPYLILPSTGWDDNYNTGRGYIQGRFRGRKMLYFESEYRFNITNNGLIGGVAFVNLQNFSSDLSSQYSKLFPGYGVGLRIKLNKYTGANLCIDYGFGQNGTGGFFVNLGEVF